MGFNQEMDFRVGMEISLTVAICYATAMGDYGSFETSNTCRHSLLTGCLQFTRGHNTVWELELVNCNNNISPVMTHHNFCLHRNQHYTNKHVDTSTTYTHNKQKSGKQPVEGSTNKRDTNVHCTVYTICTYMDWPHQKMSPFLKVQQTLNMIWTTAFCIHHTPDLCHELTTWLPPQLWTEDTHKRWQVSRQYRHSI